MSYVFQTGFTNALAAPFGSNGVKRNRDISDFSGRLRFLAALGMTLDLDEIFNAQMLNLKREKINPKIGCNPCGLEPFIHEVSRLKNITLIFCRGYFKSQVGSTSIATAD